MVCFILQCKKKTKKQKQNKTKQNKKNSKPYFFSESY